MLVEYGDYQCPHCRRAHPIVESILKQFGDRLVFGFRHFPLAKMHPRARQAAEAAEAAAAQGKFWEMHDQIFEHQADLEIADLVRYAAELGLDTQRFSTEIESKIYAPRIQEDIASGVRSGVNGTPTFFVHNKRFNGGYELASLVTALEAPPQPD